MVFRKSSRISPSDDTDFSLDFLEGTGLEEHSSVGSSQELFSRTAPATSLQPRSAEDIYADILGVEASFGIGSSNIVQNDRENITTQQTLKRNRSDGVNLLNEKKEIKVSVEDGSSEKSNGPTSYISVLQQNPHQPTNPQNVDKGYVEKVKVDMKAQPQNDGLSSLNVSTVDFGVGCSSGLSSNGTSLEKPKVKGVSTGAMHVKGLTDSLKTNNHITVKFPCSLSARESDIARLAQELSVGIYVGRALPWVSIESTNDRGAARVVALHPCYRNTLTGLVFTEIDTALKAVGGTAKGGLFLSCLEREKFLKQECNTRDWGPNGQKEPPLHLKDSQTIKLKYPSFTFSDEIFNSSEVSDWRSKWESVWSGDTGMDIQGTLSKLEIVGGGGDCAHEEIHVYSDWRVSIHDDGGKGENIKSVREEGESLCSKLLPKVPIPVPDWSIPTPSTSASSSSTLLSHGIDSHHKQEGVSPVINRHWSPPIEHGTLSYLFELLKVITGLATLFESSKCDHPSMIPSFLSEHSGESVDNSMKRNVRQQSSSNVTSIVNNGSPPYCTTASRIPFEPSIDRETNSLFLGGGVGIAAAPQNVLRRKRRTTNHTSQVPCIVVEFQNVSTRLNHFSLAKQLEHDISIFYHQVVAFGLWGNYSSSHPWIPHPTASSSSSSKRLDADMLADAIHAILPDGYSRRLKKSCREVLLSELNRPDAAQAYMLKHYRASTGSTISSDMGIKDKSVAVKKGVSTSKKEKELVDELQIYESVDLFNGDKYNGGWRLGRRHGKGVYIFSSGSTYEGEWKEGEMAGWGVYVTEDGIRRNIRHK